MFVRRATGEAGLDGTGLAGGVGGGASGSMAYPLGEDGSEGSPSADRALFSSMGSLRGSWAMILGIGSSWGGGDGGRGIDSAAVAGGTVSWLESGASMATLTLRRRQ